MQQPLTIILQCCLVIACLGCNDAPINYPEGGYDYPKSPTAKDARFYYYPLKDSFSRRDSFLKATDFFFFKWYNEPNLSIRPLDADIFRLCYTEALGHTTVIILSKNKITIKEPDVSPDFYRDDTKIFTEKEQYLLNILHRRFPLDQGRYEKQPYLRRHLDSLLKIYPQLADVNYYWSLESKRLAPGTAVKVKIRTIAITPKDFRHMVSVINASGYWKMPHEIKCDSPPTDGWGFSLEANTARKWNWVSFGSCSDDTKMQLSFCKACQEVVKYAKMEKTIGLLYSDSSIMGPVEIAPMDTTH